MLSAHALPLQARTIDAREFLVDLEAETDRTNGALATGAQAFDIIADIQTVVTAVNQALEEYHVVALSNLLESVVNETLTDPECVMGYLFPDELADFENDASDAGSTILKLYDGFSLDGFFGIPAVSMMATQQVQ